MSRTKRGQWLTPQTEPTAVGWLLAPFPITDDQRYRSALLGALFELTYNFNWEDNGIENPGGKYAPYFWETMDITEQIERIATALETLAANSDITTPDWLSFIATHNLQMPQQTTAQFQQAVALGADVVVPGVAALAETPTPIWVSALNTSLGVYAPQLIGTEQIETDYPNGYTYVASADWSGEMIVLNSDTEDVFVIVSVNNIGSEWAGNLTPGFGSPPISLNLTAGDRIVILNTVPPRDVLLTTTFTPTFPAEPKSLVNQDPVLVETSLVTVNENTYELCCDEPAGGDFMLQLNDGCVRMALDFLTGTETASGVSLLANEQARWRHVAERDGEHLIVMVGELVDSDSDKITYTLYVDGQLVDQQSESNSGQVSFSPTITTGQTIAVIAVVDGIATGSWLVEAPEACVAPVEGQYNVFDGGQAVIATIGTGVKQAFLTAGGNIQVSALGEGVAVQDVDLSLNRFQVRYTSVISPTLPISANVTIDLVDVNGVTTNVVTDEAVSGVDEFTDRVYTFSAELWKQVRVTVRNATDELIEMNVRIWGFFDS